MPFLSKMAEAAKESYRRKSFVSGDIECLYAKFGDKHVYAIRGTETQLFTRGGIIDLLRSIFFWSHKSADIHYGFAEGWNRISKDILDDYSKRKPGPLYLVGHSMGGAIALIGTAKLLVDGFDSNALGCIAFGSPRAIDFDNSFNAEMRDKIKSCCVEVIHSKDPIAPMFSFAGYDYADEPFFVGGKQKQAPWYRRSFKFHNMDEYIKELILEGR